MAKINEKKYKNTVLFFAKKIQNGTLSKIVENIRFLSSNKSLDFLKKEPDLY